MTVALFFASVERLPSAAPLGQAKSGWKVRSISWYLKYWNGGAIRREEGEYQASHGGNERRCNNWRMSLAFNDLNCSPGAFQTEIEGTSSQRPKCHCAAMLHRKDEKQSMCFQRWFEILHGIYNPNLIQFIFCPNSKFFAILSIITISWSKGWCQLWNYHITFG